MFDLDLCGQPHTLFLFTDASAAYADSIKHNYASTWNANTNHADYVIITSRDFLLVCSRWQLCGRARDCKST